MGQVGCYHGRLGEIGWGQVGCCHGRLGAIGWGQVGCCHGELGEIGSYLYIYLRGSFSSIFIMGVGSK